MSEQTFRVYVVGKQTSDLAVEITASDTREAARKFIAQLGDPGLDLEVAVITSNDFEHVYGYRSIVPQAHLDD
jgi:hypothetical protein